jgi:hypothetical protein
MDAAFSDECPGLVGFASNLVTVSLFFKLKLWVFGNSGQSVSLLLVRLQVASQ